MKRKIKVFIMCLVGFMFFAINTNIVNAATSYNDVLNGTKNLNGTISNSAELGDTLLEPEVGWSRYDDTNSKIEYIGSTWIRDTNFGNDMYKGTRTFDRSNATTKIKFSLEFKKIRILGLSGYESTVFIDGQSVGKLIKSPSGVHSVVIFEYETSTLENHDVEIVIEPYLKNQDTFISLDAIDISNESINESTNIAQLYRYNYDGRYFYTTDYSELGNGENTKYKQEDSQGQVYTKQQQGTVPLYRYYNMTTENHFYTTNFSELGNGADGYVLEKIECYVYPNKEEDTIPLYRYYCITNKSHLYTTDYSELSGGNQYFIYEGIACYVLP